MYTIREKKSRTFFSVETFDGASWGVFLFSGRDGKSNTTYDYTIAGQLVSATTGNKAESFLWDGLALIRRGGVNYLNEPHAGGGAALLAGDKVMFNDVLGTTLGIEGEGGTLSTSRGSAYGEADSTDHQSLTTDHFFTGKPYVEGLGHAFLLRNYRADLGKWQTADPLGHPDGWNNFAYCNGQVTSAVDWMGSTAVKIEYRDMSNNTVVYNQYGLSINHSTYSAGTAGVCTDPIQSAFYSTYTDTITITLSFAIYINPLLPCDWMVQYLAYGPHNGNDGGSFTNPFEEVVIAHERGHAAYIFSVLGPRLKLNMESYIANNGVPSNLNDVATEIFNQAVNNVFFDQGTGEFANQYTENYFAGSSSWIRLSDLNGQKRWSRYE